MRVALRIRKGESTIVATLMLMTITIATMGITMSFVQNNLARSQNQNDFEFAQIFMKNVGLQVDDVAWQVGQMDTLQYSSQTGEIFIREGIVEYTVTVNYIGGGQEILPPFIMNGVFFAIPVDKYSFGNNYFSELSPGNMSTLVLSRSTDPVSRVFVVQKNPIANEADYLRIGIIPVFRSTVYNITTTSGVTTTTTNYYKLLLANLVTGTSTPSAPQYVTLLGDGVTAQNIPKVKSITINVLYPQSSVGYDSSFFHFPQQTQTINFGVNGANLEIYASTVEVGYKN